MSHHVAHIRDWSTPARSLVMQTKLPKRDSKAGLPRAEPRRRRVLGARMKCGGRALMTHMTGRPIIAVRFSLYTSEIEHLSYASWPVVVGQNTQADEPSPGHLSERLKPFDSSVLTSFFVVPAYSPFWLPRRSMTQRDGSRRRSCSGRAGSIRRSTRIWHPRL